MQLLNLSSFQNDKGQFKRLLSDFERRRAESTAPRLHTGNPVFLAGWKIALIPLVISGKCFNISVPFGTILTIQSGHYGSKWSVHVSSVLTEVCGMSHSHRYAAYPA